MSILDAMDAEQGKMMNQPATTSTLSLCPRATSQPAPYATTGFAGINQLNKCHVHVKESWSCTADNMNLEATIQLWDAAGAQMLPETQPSSINANAPGSWASKLESRLVLVGEHQNDYVQFTLGTAEWKSSDTDQSKPTWCSVGAWDSKGGPSCGGRGGSLASVS